MQYGEQIEITSKVYSPTTPIKEEELFVGRKNQLDKIHEAVTQGGQHIILYGERGVGKTSLANIVSNRYRLALSPSVTCNSSSSLHGVWKSVFSKLPLNIEYRKTIGFQINPEGEKNISKVTKLSDLLNIQQNVSIDEITNLLSILSDSSVPVLFIFDEFDQVKKRELICGMSNIIKYCSDHISNITIMLVGIGNSVNDLIGEHLSIERCLKQIPIERMSDDELKNIIQNASNKIGVTMPPSIIKNIIRYSSGFPHYTHLLGKYTTLAALKRGSLLITDSDFSSAITYALENVNESIRNLYQKAIITTKRQSYFPQILTACALVSTDQHGTFRASDLEDVLQEKLGINLKMQAYQYHIGRLCLAERGNVLEKISISPTQSRYRFSNPLFKGYLMLKHYQDKFRADN